MRKKVLLGMIVSMVSISTFAGGLLTNTNQNAVFLRNPARDAVIAIDGVYSNPAGIAFLPQGFHVSLSWQAAFQKRQITSTFPYYALGAGNNGATTKLFEGKSTAPVIPSIQAAYVFNDKWSISAQFAVGGGGGKCEFDEGLATFEKLVAVGLYQGVAGNTALPTGSSLSGYSLTQQLTGEQYFYGIQLGGTYKLNDNISVFGGVRGVLANCSYVGAITGIKGDVKLPEAAGGAVLSGAATSEDYELDCSQSAFGIQPILGVDVNLGKLNLAAKYEFRAKIDLENESNNSNNVDELMPNYANGAKVRSDIPALLTVGAQYEVIPSLRLNAGYHYYFDKDAKGNATAVSDDTWEALFGVEWDVNKRLTVSTGVQRTEYGFADDEMSDLNFNVSSTAWCMGASYRFTPSLKMNVGYMHSFYGDHNVVTSATPQMSESYTRKNDVVGISLDFRF